MPGLWIHFNTHIHVYSHCRASQWAILIFPHMNISRLILNISTMLSVLKVIKEVIKFLKNNIEVRTYTHILSLYIQYALLVYYKMIMPGILSPCP